MQAVQKQPGVACAPPMATFIGRRVAASRTWTQYQHKQCNVACNAMGDVILEVSDLHAKIAGTDKEILKGVNLTLCEGEVHAIMGKNGSGKSTFSKVSACLY